MCDLVLHCVKAHDQLLVACHPVYDRVCQVLEILRLLLASLHVHLRRFLKAECVLTAAADPFSAQFQAFVHLAEWPFVWGVEAVH